jgi:hypothetical protein
MDDPKNNRLKRREALKRIALSAVTFSGLAPVISLISSCQKEDIGPFSYDSLSSGSYSNYNDLYSSYFDYTSYSSYSSYSSYASYASYSSYSGGYYNYYYNSGYYNYYDQVYYYNYVYLDWSDAGLKKNIRSIKNALSLINKLQGVKFEYNDKLPDRQGEQIGFVAQDIQKVLPEVVRKQGDYLAIQYGNINALLLEGIKEQQKIIEKLSEASDSKDKDIADLNARLHNIEAKLNANTMIY